MRTDGHDMMNLTVAFRNFANAPKNGRKMNNALERVRSQTQLCQLRCLMTILDSYMFRPLLAIFRLSLRELKVLVS